MKALEFMNTECDSFAGRHIWTIVALSFLFLVLLCLFLPVCVCGGYPCCPGKKADKISSGATRCTVSVDGTRDQPKRGGRRPIHRQNSGLSSISSGFSDMLGGGKARNDRMDRRSRLNREASGRSGISSISSGFSGFGGNKKRQPRRGRRPEMNRQNSCLSALSDDFEDEAIERRNARDKAGRENMKEPGHAEPWFYPQPEPTENSGLPRNSGRSRAASYDSGMSVDIQSNEAYVGPSAAPPRRNKRGVRKTNSFDSAYSGASGERTSLY